MSAPRQGYKPAGEGERLVDCCPRLDSETVRKVLAVLRGGAR